MKIRPILKTRLTLLSLFAAGAATGAVVDLGAPWERWDPANGENNQYAIYAVYDFQNANNPAQPDNLAVIDSNPIKCDLCPNNLSLPIPQATWSSDNGGQWDFNAFGQIFGQLTNVVDNRPLKLGQAQITTVGDPSHTFEITAAFDIPNNPTTFSTTRRSATQLADDPLGRQRWVTVWDFIIEPNPNNESFRIDVFDGTSIDGIIIDTFSVPEPGSAMLLGLGSLGLLLRRRRS